MTAKGGTMTDKGPGNIGDAPSAFGAALAAAAKALGHEPAGDAHVTAAVQLGWVMGSLITPGAQTPLPSGFPIDAATVYKAKGLELAHLLVEVAVPVTPGPDALTAQLQTGAAATAQAETWESTLVAALLAHDVRLAKAYGVGRQLNLIAYDPAQAIASPEVTGMIDALDDLTSALPAHAGRGVANSVRLWQDVEAGHVPGRDVLEAQCELWRTVLTGEKLATQLLEPENYIDAAEQLAVKLRATAAVLLRQYLVWVIVILVLLFGGAALLLIAPNGASDTAAGLSGVLAALGLTYKGVGPTLGKLAGQVEAPLWGAELDGAVTAAITLSVVAPPPPSRLHAISDLWRRRRTVPGGDYAGRTQRRPGFDPAKEAGE
jgi:hypothetical protein